MKITKKMDRKIWAPALFTAISSLSTTATAFEFQLGEIQGSFDSTLSVGASWRVSNIDKDQIAIVNGGYATSVNYDDGDLNFKRGETFSKIFKGVHELELRYKNFGAFVRGRYFYDFELQDEHRPFKELDPQALDRAGHGADFLDSFVWANFDIAEKPVTIRFGSQVVSWGESTFIQGGINTINPIDVNAFRKPGAEIKEGLLPVNMIYGSFGITENITVEAFYQLDWKPTEIDPCGTYFSTADFVSGRNGNGCGPVVLTGAFDDADEILAAIQAGVFPPTLYPVANRLSDIRPRDDGQFGVALRWFAESLNDTEFGFYFINYHSRLPLTAGVNANYGPPGPNSIILPAGALGPNIQGSGPGGSFLTGDLGIAPNPFNPSQYFDFPDYSVKYPEDIRLYGFSFQTTGPWGIAISGELSYRPNLPIALNAFELLTGANLFPTSTAYKYVTPGQAGNGYERHPALQGQMTMVKFFDQVLGADRVTLVGEVGFLKVNGIKGSDEDRFGVSGKFGQVGGNPPPYDQLPCLSKDVDGVSDSRYCYKGGYDDGFSWGYRLRAAFTYNNAFAGINLTPVIGWSHDVNGRSPGPGGPFNEGAKAISLTLNAEYLNAYRASVSYTNFFGGGFYNEINDRDFVSVDFSYSF